ncbi:HlyD family type I secretion periplasmic adaptor subunit [Sulfitobacter sp.]|uniref:HlyD family type I secretion periplasmic adaptor subunit n=1 Tax=Sulfitobacter sp. TaxID=1903071 RepID=UPI0035693C26
MPANVILRVRTGLGRLFLAGGLGVLILFVALGGWAATTKISGAVAAQGQIDVRGKPKTVQSLDGGILAHLAVANGDAVQAGQILARLDPTLLQINLDMARTRLAAALGLRARLEAERAGATALVFDYSDISPTVRALELDMTKAEAGQRAIFAARAEMRLGGRAQAVGSVEDIKAQQRGVAAQITAIEQQLSYLALDLRSLQKLENKGLVRRQQLSDTQRAHAALSGDLAGRRADLAALANRIREITREALQDERRFQEQVVTDLRDVATEIEELALSIVTRQAQLDRTDIRAPADGVIHELQVTTLGGVIAPGGTLLNIVPQNSGYEFEVRVAPQSIDRVRQNQRAQVVFSAFDQQTTPQLVGRVRAISPEVIEDMRSGQSFYRVSLELPQDELARLPETAHLLPGMPLEAFLETRDRTVLSYLTEPITTHLRRGFRE